MGRKAPRARRWWPSSGFVGVLTRQRESNLQDLDGRSHIGSGFTWMANADSQDSDQFPTLPYKICPSLSEFTISPLLGMFLVNDLKVRRNQPQSSNFAFKVRASKNLRGLCRSRGGRCQGTNGNSSYIFSAEKCTFIIKYSKVWKWCRTFSANSFDLKVRH